MRVDCVVVVVAAAVNGNNETVNNRQTTRHVPVAATATVDRSPVRYSRRNAETVSEICTVAELNSYCKLLIYDLLETRPSVYGAKNTSPGVDMKKYIFAVNNIIEHYTSDTVDSRV